jgi:chromosomal replication initiator protein
MTGSVWQDILHRIETKVNRHSFDTWFVSTRLISDDGTTIRVQVPDPLAVDWLSRHYTAVLDEAMTEVGRGGTRLLFLPEGAAAPPPGPPLTRSPPSRRPTPGA